MNTRVLLFSSFAILLIFAEPLPADDMEWRSSDPAIQQLITEGAQFEQKKKFGEALETYLKILKIKPNEKRAMAVVGGIYGMKGNYLEELEWTKKLLKLDPQYWIAYLNHGTALLELKRPQLARRAYLKAMQLNPESPLPLLGLGNLEEQMGNYSVALSWYQQTIKKDPQSEGAYFNLAAMQANLGLLDDAKKSLAQVLKLNPNAKDAQTLLASVEKKQQLQKAAPTAPVKK